MNRFVLGLALLSMVSFGAWAQEFQVDSSTGIGLGSTAGSEFSLSERLDGTFTLPFDLKGSGLEVAAHAQASVPLAASADLDALNVTFVYQDLPLEVKGLKWTFGRFALSEPTGLILNHPGDGTKLVFDFGGFDLTLQAAYLGWLLRSTSGVSLTLVDQARSNDIFASPRFVGSLQTGVTVFGDHRITFGALAQQDLNNRDNLLEEWSLQPDSTKGGALDTQYLTLKAEGPVVDKVFYEVFGTFGSGSTLSYLADSTVSSGSVYQYKPVLSFLSGASVTWFLPEFLASSFSARVLVGSGDSDSTSAIEGNVKDASGLFVPVTGTSLGVVFNPGLGNLAYYELGGSLKPLPGLPLVTGVKALGFQRTGPGVVNASGVLKSEKLWMGEELDVTASWQPFSDLAVSGALGAYLPGDGTFTSGALQYSLSASAKLSL